jgi:hypothetical protein
MDLATLRSSLRDPAPPPGLPPLLTALWHAGKGEWEAAHNLAQQDSSAEGAWVHAYLHRVEGDESNAGYWYRRADRPHCKDSLETEWGNIAEALLQRSGPL